MSRAPRLNTNLALLEVFGVVRVTHTIAAGRPAWFTSLAAILTTFMVYASWSWASRGTWKSATRQVLEGRRFGRLAEAEALTSWLSRACATAVV